MLFSVFRQEEWLYERSSSEALAIWPNSHVDKNIFVTYITEGNVVYVFGAMH